MKITKIVLIFTIIILAISFQTKAQESATTLLEKAQIKATKENKFIFVKFEASWCGWCHKMTKNMKAKTTKKFFEDDPRIQLVNQDATLWIEENKELQFDLIFADTWAGKFTHLDSILNMVKPGGFYLIDDLNYQVDWHKNHQDKVLLLVEKLKCHPDFFSFPIDVGTGMLLLCKK